MLSAIFFFLSPPMFCSGAFNFHCHPSFLSHWTESFRSPSNRSEQLKTKWHTPLQPASTCCTISSSNKPISSVEGYTASQAIQALLSRLLLSISSNRSGSSHHSDSIRIHTVSFLLCSLWNIHNSDSIVPKRRTHVRPPPARQNVKRWRVREQNGEMRRG